MTHLSVHEQDRLLDACYRAAIDICVARGRPTVHWAYVMTGSDFEKEVILNLREDKSLDSGQLDNCIARFQEDWKESLAASKIN